MSGYIKLHRAVRGTAIAQHPEYFAAWVHLLCMASHKPHQQIVGTKVVDLQPGQLVFGRQRFSATTGISENKVRASLSVLKDLRMITSKSHAKFSVITITNWSKYQESAPANNQHSTSTQPALNHEQEGSKNGKNEQEVDTVISYLNNRAGKKFKSVKGHAKHINARLAEGHTVEDMKHVIDSRVLEWSDDPKMAAYLRPSTLFNEDKFDGYLNSTSKPATRKIKDFPTE
jgi:uncharacterized phage protein (TIGR02220 family)